MAFPLTFLADDSHPTLWKYFTFFARPVPSIKAMDCLDFGNGWVVRVATLERLLGRR
jgi:hypothetical protein